MKQLLTRARQFTNLARTHGVRSAVTKSVHHVAMKTTEAVAPKIDPIGHYGFILGEPTGIGLKITPDNVPQGSMSWLIPDFNASSGGHINIFRMMTHLRAQGFPNQHVVVMEPHRWGSAEEAKAALDQWFPDNGLTISLDVKSIEPSQFVVATSWETAYWVAKYRDAMHKLYFVQDFEPMFYSEGSESAFAENTYKLGLTGITAGTWLAEKLASDYGMKTFGYQFGVDKEFYVQTEKRPSAHRNIFFYARPVTPRRCFEVGLLALQKVCEKNPDAAVIFAGWDVSNYEIPFHHLNAGTISLGELPDLYSQCDAALILSSTNLSLLPLEVASCGCPIVMNKGANTEWLMSDDELWYADMDPDSIAEAIDTCLNNKPEAEKRATKARERALNQSWEHEAGRVAEFLGSL